MAEQITVGLRIEIEELEGNAISEKLRKPLQQAQKELQAIADAGDLGINDKAVKTLINLLNEIQDAFADLQKLFKSNAKIAIEINDEDITKFKTAVEGIFDEILAKWRSEFLGVAKQFGDVISSKAATTGSRKRVEDVAGEQQEDTKIGPRLKQVSAELFEFEDKMQATFKGIHRIVKEGSQIVEGEAGEFAGDLTSIFKRLDIQASGKFRKQVGQLQGDILEIIESLQLLRQEGARTGRLETDTKFASDLKKAESSAKSLAIATATYGERLEAVNQISKRSVDLDKRRARNFDQLKDLAAQAPQAISQALNSLDDSPVTELLARMRSLSQKLTEEARGAAGEINRIDRELEKARGSAEQLENIIAQTADEELKRSLGEQLDVFRQIEAELERQIKRYQDYEEEIVSNQQQGTHLIRGLQNTKKELSEQEEGVQRAIIAYEKLKTEIGSVVKRFQEVDQRAQGVEFFDQNDVAEAQAALKKVEAQMGKVSERIAQLKQARETAITSVSRRAEQGTGEFEGLDKSQRDKLLQERTQEIETQFAKRIAKARAFKVELDEILDTAGQSGGIRELIAEFERLDKTDGDIESINKKVRTMQDRFANVSTEVGETSSDLLRQAKIIASLEDEYGSLTKGIDKLESELRQMKREGVGGAEEIEERLKSLKRTRDILDDSFQQLRLGSGGSQSPQELKLLSKDAEKATQDIQELTNSAGRLEQRMGVLNNELGRGGSATVAAAKGLKNIQSAAEQNAAKLQEAVQALLQMEAAGYKLSPVQKQLINDARELADANQDVAFAVKQNRESINRQEDAALRAGQGFKLYGRELEDSIKNNFKFINAIAIITTAMLAVRTAFTELIEESKAFARTMTVMRSQTKSFEAIFQELQQTVRDTAIKFGEAVSDVAEVVKQFGSAGLSAEESFDGLNSTMQLIISTQADAEDAARQVAGVYNVFGDQLRKTQGQLGAFVTINDTLASVYRNHQAELDEVIQGLQFSAAAGKAAGFQFQEISAFLAVLNDNLIKSGKAGRGLQVLFSQLARKTDDFSKIFNIPLDPDSPLSEQFVGILEAVNSQLSAGALTVKELEKQFKIFGLRGARSFITLAKNVDDVTDTLDELEGSAGTVEELAGVVQNSLAKQFEQAKQSLLDFAREALVPLKEGIVFLTDVIQQFREGVEAVGPAIKTLAGIGLVSVLFLGFVQTLRAVFAIARTLAAQLVQMAGGLKAAGVGAIDAAARFQVLAGAVGRTTAVTATASAAFKGLYAAVGGIPGLIALVATTIITLLPVIGQFNESITEIEGNIEKLSSEMTQAFRDIKSLETFRKDLSEIENDINNTAITSEQAGDRIRKAFDKVGSKLIANNEVLLKSNKELAESYEEIATESLKTAKLLEEARKKEAQESARDQITEVKKLVEKEIKEGGQFSLVLDDAAFENLFKLDQNIVALSGLKRAQSLLDEQTKAVRKQRAALKQGTASEDVQKQYQEQVDALNEINKTLLETENKVKAAFIDNPKESTKIIEELYQALDDDVRKAIENLRGGVLDNVVEPISAAKDASEETFGVLNGLLEKFGKALPQNAFDDISESLAITRDEANRADKAIRQIVNGESAFNKSFGKNPAKTFVGLSGDSFKQALKDATRTFDEDSAEAKSLARKIGETVFGDEAFFSESDNQINKVISVLTERLEDGSLTVDQFGSLLNTLGEQGGVSVNKITNAFANVAKAEILEEGRRNPIENLINQLEAATIAATTLNDITAKQQEINFLSQLIDTSEQSVGSLEDLQAQAIGTFRQIQEARAFAQGKGKGAEADPQTRQQAAKEANKLEAEELQNLFKRLELTGNLIKARKDLIVKTVQQRNELERVNIVLSHREKAIQGIVAEVEAEAELFEHNTEALIEQLEVEEKLVGAEKAKVAGLIELRKQHDALYELQQKARDSAVEEEELRFETLAAIEEQLNKSNQLAGTNFRIQGIATRIANINGKLNKLHGSKNQKQSKYIDLVNQYVEYASEAFEIEDQILEKQKEQNDVLNTKISIFEKLRDLFGEEADFFESQIQKALKAQLEANKIATALELSQITGRGVADVLKNTDEVLKEVSEKLREGKVDARNFGSAVEFITIQAARFNEKQEEYSNSVTQLVLKQRELARERIDLELGRDNIQGAISAINEFVSLSEKLKDEKGADFVASSLREAVGLIEVVNQRSQELDNELKLRVGIENDQDLFDFFDGLRKRLKGFKEDLVEIGEVGSKSLKEIADGTRIETEIVADITSNITHHLNRAKADIINKIEQVRGFQDGGYLPGYGGGDKIPAMLEAGEFVIPKEIVSAFGPDFFEYIRKTGKLPGFQEGGLVKIDQKMNNLLNNPESVLVQDFVASLQGRGLDEIAEDIKSGDLDPRFWKVKLEEFANNLGRDASDIIKDLDALNKDEILSPKIAEFYDTVVTFIRTIEETSQKIGAGLVVLGPAFLPNAKTGELVPIARRGNSAGSSTDFIGNNVPKFLEEFAKFNKRVDISNEELEQLSDMLEASKKAEAARRKAEAKKNLGSILDLLEEEKEFLELMQRGPALEDQADFDKATKQRDFIKPLGLNQGGYLPGYGGGDKIPALLEAGEFVIPKEVVASFGPQFFELLRTTGKLPGFKSGGAVGGGSGGAVNVNYNIGGDNLSISELRQFTKDLVFSTSGALEDARKIGEILLEESKFGKVWKFFKKGAEDAFDFISGLVETVFSEEFLLQVAEANAEAKASFEETITGLNEQFKQTFDQIEEGLQRNQTSYFDYINAIQDAEQERMRARMDAEKQYREQLEQNKKQFYDAGFIQPIVKVSQQASDLLSKVGFSGESIGADIQGLTGSIKQITSLRVQEKNVPKQIGRVAKRFADDPELSEALTGELTERLDELVGKRKAFQGVALKKLNKVVTKSIANGFLKAGSMILGQIGNLLGQLANPEAFNQMIESLMVFIERLPETAPKFIKKIIENIDDLFLALAEALPALFEIIATELPNIVSAIADGLAKALPEIIKALGEQLPVLIENLVPALTDLIIVLVENIPALVEALVKALPTLVVEIIKALPRILGALIEAMIMLIPHLIKGLIEGIKLIDFKEALSDIFGNIGEAFKRIGSAIEKFVEFFKSPVKKIGKGIKNIFHDGGLVEGRDDEVIALLQTGEGVLTRDGLRFLGGPGVLEEINKGKVPTYHDGGVVGNTSFNVVKTPNIPQRLDRGSGSTSYQVNNNINVGGPLTTRQRKDIARQLADDIDNELARKVKNRDSNLDL